MGKEWIKNLKVGDKVVVANIHRKNIVLVEKITPTGRINAGGIKFDNNGHELVGHKWGHSSLMELTPEFILKFKWADLVNQCKNIDFRKHSIEKLEAILKIIKE